MTFITLTNENGKLVLNLDYIVAIEKSDYKKLGESMITMLYCPESMWYVKETVAEIAQRIIGRKED